MPTMKPPSRPMPIVGNGRTTSSPMRPPLLPAAAIEHGPQHHGGRAQQERGAQDSRCCPRPRSSSPQVEHVGPDEGGRDRAGDHPADQPVVDRVLGHMDDGAHGPHQYGRHQVARNGGRRLDPEEEDQHRRHQGATSGAGHADEESDDGTAEDDVGIDRHGRGSGRWWCVPWSANGAERDDITHAPGQVSWVMSP